MRDEIDQKIRCKMLNEWHFLVVAENGDIEVCGSEKGTNTEPKEMEHTIFEHCKINVVYKPQTMV